MARPKACPVEFDLIRRFLAPLAAGNPAALDLTDDVALLTPPGGRQLVLTTDTIVAGVHYPMGEPAGEIARRLLRVNLSDLAAKGARPEGYLLNLGLAPEVDEVWLDAFTSGLAEDQARFGVGLLGGDTVSMPGPLVLTLTAIGSVAAGRALLRRGARPGDTVHVSGSIGDGLFGLHAVQGKPLPGLDGRHRRILAEAFRRPEPRLALGAALAEKGLATAAADISDGLLADLGHICEASGAAAVIEAARVPLSAEGRVLVGRDPNLLPQALAGGDDYELVFTAPPEAADALAALAAELALPLTAIGHVAAGQGVRVLDANGRDLSVAARGYQHR